MALYTLAQVAAKIAALDAKIEKAETAQSYDAGAAMRLARGDLAAMYRERQHWIKQYQQLEAAASGGFVNKVQFQRPR